MASSIDSTMESAPTAAPTRRLEDYVERHFEHVFVLLTLAATALINYFIPHKFAFLNFYFLPVIEGSQEKPTMLLRFSRSHEIAPTLLHTHVLWFSSKGET